jgi:crotonobetainyl-CoA:carnitine CoA-transferase CaiB-like acyl-CoA transferase
MNQPQRPLHNIRVIDFTEALAGPICGMMLGDLGANVIKVERPNKGDQARGYGPPFVEGESAYFMALNRNKRSLTLDISTNKGQEIIGRLLQQADVFLSNRPTFSCLIYPAVLPGKNTASIMKQSPR